MSKTTETCPPDDRRDGDRFTLAPAEAADWEVRLAWLFRLLIAATAVAHLWLGEYLYALLDVVGLAIVLVPPYLARTGRANVPIELELALLWWVVADFTLGRLGGLYETSVWFDKATHLGNSVLLGMLAFLFLYALHFTGHLRTAVWVRALAIFLITLGLGAAWEIAEYVADLLFARGAMGSPGMSKHDDTMVDLILDAVGGIGGAFIGTYYIARSKRTICRLKAFAELLDDDDEPTSAAET